MGEPRLQFYNTLTRRKEVFEPIDANNIRVYVCGPTVYDYAHIGNARPAIVFDVLFRVLRHHFGADQVTYVRNITDVDDKINARAARDYPDMALNDAIALVTKKTTDQYHADVRALGCLEPTIEPRATDNIPQMLDMIASLIDKGHAYQAGGEVLFDVQSMARYGALSNRKLEDQQAGARVAVEKHKRNAADFVLWKQSTQNEPGWESPWGLGRPGWHLECSAMSKRYLGEVFDIHGGGLDLIFPHHENEIAQSCCSHDTERMANVWMHNGYLQVEGKKMSKSVGNFITINQLLDTDTFGGRRWPGEVLRLAMLMTHYREPIDFSQRKLEEAENLLDKFARKTNGHDSDGPVDETFMRFMSDDLNFSGAMAQLNALDGRVLASTLKLLGFETYRQAATRSVDEEMIAERIAQRLLLIGEKNWTEADAIRDALLSEGIQLKDGKDPETGERVTSWVVL